MQIPSFDTQHVDLDLNPVLLDSGCRRSSTIALRYRAIAQAMVSMRTRFMDQITLPEIAEAAQLSPFHFNRVFRSMTGIQPSVFLAALRMEEAKKLLLTTKRSVTDICFDVGYTSLGTFTSRFGSFVGLAPSRFRQLAHQKMMQISPQDVWHHLAQLPSCPQGPGDGYVTGLITVPEAFEGLIFVGLFADPLPQGAPVGCALLTAPGTYSISGVPDGRYYVFATAIDRSQNFLTVLTHGPTLHGGLGQGSITLSAQRKTEQRNISLGPPSWADPPIVVAFPWLLISRIFPMSQLL